MEPGQHGIGNDHKHSEMNHSPSEPSIIEGTLPSLKLHPDEPRHDHDNEQPKEGSSLGLKQHPEAKHDDGSETTGEGVGLRCSHSSSSSSSTSDDVGGHISDASDKYEHDEFQSPDVSTQTPQWSMVSASPRGGSGNLYSTDCLGRTPDWVMSTSSTMKSPPPQAMGRGYDPNRIPTSIFSAKPTTPDWSVASNESLFSIHMGQNSFSRDNFIPQGLDLGKPEEWNNGSEPKYYELNTFTPNLPPVVEASTQQHDSRTNIYVRPGLEEELDETPKAVGGEDNCNEKLADDAYGARLSTCSNMSNGRGMHPTEPPRNSVSDPRVSNESARSGDSFAFPVLLSDGVKGGSLKAIDEKPETPKAQTEQDPKPIPEEAPAPANCFSCFKCWPPRCC